MAKPLSALAGPASTGRRRVCFTPYGFSSFCPLARKSGGRAQIPDQALLGFCADALQEIRRAHAHVVALGFFHLRLLAI